MPLFQNSVITKYLNAQDKSILANQWNVFKSHFLNPKVQEDIKSLKEEQYQGEFLEDLFVKILGYTKPASSSQKKYNLTTEYKNVKDSKKADGAIIINESVKAVIELKGTNTTDLGKIESQAFGYKNNQPECVYVITSNFEKLRFYIDNTIEHLEFNLFTLTEKEFEVLYLCLAYDNLEKNIPKRIKEESVSQEDIITKKLYKDYSLFKRELHHNLVELNPQYEPLELFQKSQKLLDRFLFIFFAEDRQLLPTNLIFRINKEWQQLRQMRIEVSLYDRYKIYFADLNTGAKVSLPAFHETAIQQKEEYQIFAYNGGLFKDDEILNSLKIDDGILFKYTESLSNYDFASEVDVNILGHIFENSLNELDEVKAQLEGKEIDKSKTKRKKDGVFYTPKYITKYIVDNTIGKLCFEKKAELTIIEEDYFTDKKRQKKTIKILVDKLTDYRNWLLQLTICDPACGSGAFLNQALDFLINEHKYIDELQAKLFGDALVMSDVEKSILENNLFGVDLNEESVEIAKLSLWLRTAQPNRKLNDLNDNIKCGNSLIDDPKVVGDKAFNWEAAFPKIFDKGGFDVIIGNPPYGAKFNQEEILFYNDNYKFQNYQLDSYLLFTEKLISLIKPSGIGSYIMPNTWLSSLFAEKIRNFVLNNFSLLEINHYSYFVFEDATVETDTYIFRRDNNVLKNYIQLNIIEKNGITLSHQISQQELIEKNGKPINIFEKKEYKSIKNKLQKYKNLGGLTQIVQGTKPFQKGKGNPKQDEDIMINQPYVKNHKENDTFKPLLRGSLMNRYLTLWDKDYWISYGDWLAEPRYSAKFECDEKIVIRQTGDSLIATIDTNKFIVRDNLYVIRDDDKNFNLKFLLCIINSTLLTWYFRKFINPEEGKTMAQVKRGHLCDLPIAKNNLTNQKPFIEKAEQMLSHNKDLQQQSQKFQRTIQRKFELEELPKKLQDWYKLSYPEFIKELGKKKVKLSLSQEAEWEDYFIQESKKALDLKDTLDATDKAIDVMVYELYGLSEEEIEIVEGN